MRKLLIPLCFSLLFACEHDVPLSELELSIKPQLILDGGISPGYLMCVVKISQSISNTNDLESLNTAEIFVFKDDILNKQIKPDLYNDSAYYEIVDSLGNRMYVRKLTGYYYWLHSDLITAGSNYTIQAKVPGYDTLYAFTYIPHKVPIHLVDYKYAYNSITEYRYSMTFKVDDPPGENNYYHFGLSGQIEYQTNNLAFWYQGLEYDYTNSYTFSDKSLNNNCFTIEVIENIQNALIRVPYAYFSLYQMDSAGYFSGLTFNAQDKMMMGDGFFGFEPVNVYSNVKNGFGSLTADGPSYVDSIDLKKLFPVLK